MRKILYISNIAGKHFSFGFCGASLTAAQKLGFQFIGVANRSKSSDDIIREDEKKYNIKLYNVPINRSPFSFKNFKAFKEICDIIRNERIDIIHCNTPVGGLLGRLAGKKCKVRTIIYQVHGFHFYKGAPLKNWLLYYPIEKWLSRYTDCLITINKDDFLFAKKNKMIKSGGTISYVHGVGIDLDEIKKDKYVLNKKDLGLENQFVFLVVGRLEKNKNCSTIIKAASLIKNKNFSIVFCGEGNEKDKLLKLAKNKGIENKIFFMGNRSDINDFYNISDCFISSSLREGLSRSIMEAMSFGLPCIVSKIRGNVDLIDINGGFLCDVGNVLHFSKAMELMILNSSLKSKMGSYNLVKIKQFDLKIVTNELIKIYQV